MSTPQPFVVGRSYRVKKTIEDSFSAIREGQVLRYLERGFAVYDETWCFNFLDDQGKRLYWCIHDSEPIDRWREVFEEEPITQRTPEMANQRHQVLRDRPFWSWLEYALSGWLAASGEPHLRWLSCDGFLPESISDTQFGVDVEGIAWVGNGRTQHPFRFAASLPQKLLQSDRENIGIDQLCLDQEQQTLTLTIRETRDPLPEHRS